MTSMFKKQWVKLREKKYREHLVAAEVKRGIPFQMRNMLKQRGWKQEQLAEASGLTQGAISRALNPNYGNLALNTIIRIAAGFDVAFIGMFVPFSKLADLEGLTDDRSALVPPFIEEDADKVIELPAEEPSDRVEAMKQVQFRMAKAEINPRRIETSRTADGLLRDDATTDDGDPIHNSGARELSVMYG